MQRNVIYSHGAKVGGHGLGLVAYHQLKTLYDAGLLLRGIAAYGSLGPFPGADIRLFPWMRAMFYLLRDRPRLRGDLYDRVASRCITPCALFHGWTGQSLRSARRAQALGAKIVVERGSPHERDVHTVLAEEHARWGVPYQADTARDIARADATYALADRILVLSPYCRATMLDAGLPPEKVVVTPRAADDTAFYPAASPPERFAVLFAGDIGLRKGLPYLLEAWDRLALPGAELWLAGRVRSDGRFLAERYGQRDDVRFPGHVADMPALYRQASICVLPSLSEGSAKVLYEAMASGLPIVYTTACGAVAQNGVEGIQVPARDVDALALAIERLYQDADLRRAMGQAGVRLMAEYTWEHARARWLRLYHSLLAE